MNNLDKQYIEIMNSLLIRGHKKSDRTGTGTTSLFGKEIRHNMKDGFPLLTTKKLYTKGIIHELLWFLKGDTNIKYLQDNKTKIWDEWADKDGNLGPVYGKQWVNWKGYSTNDWDAPNINQIQNAIDMLNNNPDSRRNMVSAWNVGELEDMALMPCHYGFQLYTRELSHEERVDIAIEVIGDRYKNTDSQRPVLLDNDNIPKREISLMWNQRSVDTLLGLPYNIASYAFLLEMFAQQTNMVAGELIGRLGDTHLYDNHIKYANEQVQRDPHKYELPKLRLCKPKDIFSYTIEDFLIEDYEAYPNWTGDDKPPIAV